MERVWGSQLPVFPGPDPFMAHLAAACHPQRSTRQATETPNGLYWSSSWIFKVSCYYSSSAETGLQVPEARKRTRPAGRSQGGCSPLQSTFQTSFQRLPTAGGPCPLARTLLSWQSAEAIQSPWGLWQPPRGLQPSWVMSSQNDFDS